MYETTELSEKRAPQLQVMICTYGREGLERVALSSRPRVKDVEYIVSCQIDSEIEDFQAPKALDREDFRIFTTLTKGLSVNRNIALSQATAPLLLISDDDVDYTEEGLLGIIQSFTEHPDADILAFRYESTSARKFYPDSPVSLDLCPKGYYVSSIEIAMRRQAVQGKVWFNENFGIGALFPSGEEDIFLRDCLDRGLKGTFIPITIARHDGPTTSERNLMLPSRPLTKGAVFTRLHPYSWPFRMIAHALREIPLWRKGITPNPISYCSNWIKGAVKARRHRVFNRHDSRKNNLMNE